MGTTAGHRAFLVRLAAIFLALLVTGTPLVMRLLPTALAQTNKPQPELMIQNGHGGSVMAVAYSASGRLMATGSSDETVKLWDARTAQLLATLKDVGHQVYAVVFSPDSRLLASSGKDTAIKLWDIAAKRITATLQDHEGLVGAVAFSPDGKQLASGSQDNTVKLWDVSAGQVLQTWKGHAKAVVAVAFSPDGKRVASGSLDNTVRIWERLTGKLLFTLTEAGELSTVAFSPDGKRLAAGGQDNTVKLWHAASGKLLATLKGHESSVSSIAFSPNGKRMATGSQDNTVKLWDAASGKLLGTLQGHSDYVNAVAFSADGKHLASGSSDKSVKLWQVATRKLLTTLEGHSYVVRSVAFSPDGKRMATGCQDNTVKLWDTSTGRLVTILQGHGGWVDALAFSRDGKLLASGGQDHAVKVWDAGTGKLKSEFKGHDSPVSALAFSPDGRRLASTGAVVKLWDLDQAGSPAIMTLEHATYINSVAFSPDGHRLATAGKDIILWEVAAGSATPLLTLKGHGGTVNSVAFSPDGKSVASGSEDNSVKLWDSASGKILDSLSGHASDVSSIAFSPDGKWLASGSYDNTARVWNPAAGKLVNTMQGHSGLLSAVAFSADSKRLATASADHTVRFWDAQAGKELSDLILLDQEDWVAFTPKGQFDSSAGGSRYIGWKVGEKIYSFDQFKEQYYIPELLALLWNDQPLPVARQDIRQGIAPPPEVTITSPAGGATVDQEQLKVTAEVKDMGGGVSEFRCYHQGKLVLQEGRSGLPSTALTGPRGCLIALVPGINDIRVSAFNAAGIESSPAGITVERKAPEVSAAPNLWILVIGINKYKDADLTLRYARPDAEAIVAAIPQRARALVKEVFAKTLYDDQATKAGIAEALGWLKGSKPQDTVVIYLAGHGDTVDEKYYFLPHELAYTSADALVAGGVGEDIWKEALKNTPALKLFLVLDTCKSGALVKMAVGFAAGEKRALSILGLATGVTLLAASTDKQQALEDTKFGHGILTHVLLEGLGGEARDRKGRITARGLLKYAEERVAELTEELFKKRQYPVGNSTGQDFAIGTVP